MVEMGLRAKTAVLLGASGLVGGYCLQTLLADSQYARIVLLGRRELVAARHPRLTQKLVDFDALTQSDFADADEVFCALGTTMRKAGSQQGFHRVEWVYSIVALLAALCSLSARLSEGNIRVGAEAHVAALAVELVAEDPGFCTAGRDAEVESATVVQHSRPLRLRNLHR